MDILALILAGGLGKRLRPLTDRLPKPMLTINGRPILEWQVEILKRQGVRRFVFLVGYKAEAIEEYFGDGSSLGIEIRYSRESEPLGTGGALRNAARVIDREVFLMLNGDVITNLDIKPLLSKLESNEDIEAVIAAVELPSPYGILEIDENGMIRRFVEKPTIENTWINAGIYAMRRSIVEKCPEKGDIEKTVFPQLAVQGRLAAVKYTGVVWKSIDSHKDIEEATEAISEIIQK